MKNLKKLTRENLKNVFGGILMPDNGGQWCHFTYTGTLWGSDMKETSYGEGKCAVGAKKCYSYFATGAC